MRTLATLVVVGHLQTSPPEATFDVETFVCLAAIQNSLVAADILGDVVECLDDAQTQLLALLVLGNGDVFNMADLAKTVDTGSRKS